MSRKAKPAPAPIPRWRTREAPAAIDKPQAMGPCCPSCQDPQCEGCGVQFEDLLDAPDAARIGEAVGSWLLTLHEVDRQAFVAALAHECPRLVLDAGDCL